MNHRWLFVFTLIVPLQLSGVAYGQSDEQNVIFRWGFGVVSGEGDSRVLTPVTKDTTLKSGDELKMVVELRSDCFVYVVYESSTGDMALLFPYDLQQFSTDYVQGKNYYIPKGREWFTLDEKVGRETFFLIASNRRLNTLETLFEKQALAKGSDRAKRAKEIVTEIRNLRRQHRSYTSVAERPISIGGNVRGTPPAKASGLDVADIALEISAHNFYSKTFTIDHR